jgi:hypothetical protein
MRMKWGFVLAGLVLCSSVFGDVLTVPGDSSTIQGAINAADPGDIVIVSPGFYQENLFLGEGITVTSTDPSDPNVVADTIIDGGGSDTVITCVDVDPNGVIAGFWIQNGDGGSSNGGGIWCEDSYLTIKNCIFSSNETGYFGAGIYCYLGAPTIASCTFIGNVGDGTVSYGGGIGCYQSDVTVANCMFSGNDAVRGGAIALYDCDEAAISNCTFSKNLTKSGAAGGFGGAIYTNLSTVTVINSIMWEDFATQGSNDEIYIDSGTLTMSYSVAQGCGGSGIEWVSSYGIDAGNNMDIDPLFIDADGADDMAGTADDDVHLDPYSLCINAGDPNGVYTGQADMDLAARVRYGGVDIGADEVFYIGGDLSKDGSVGVADLALFTDSDKWLVDYDLADFALFATHWLLGVTEPVEGDLNGDGKVDMTDLAMFVDTMWLAGADLDDFAVLSGNWLVGVE